MNIENMRNTVCSTHILVVTYVSGLREWLPLSTFNHMESAMDLISAGSDNIESVEKIKMSYTSEDELNNQNYPYNRQSGAGVKDKVIHSLIGVLLADGWDASKITELMLSESFPAEESIQELRRTLENYFSISQENNV